MKWSVRQIACRQALLNRHLMQISGQALAVEINDLSLVLKLGYRTGISIRDITCYFFMVYEALANFRGFC